MNKYISYFCYLMIIFCTLWIVGFIFFINNIPNQSQAIENTDAVVILTGGKGRISEAIEIIAKNMAQKMLITGIGHNASISDIIFLSDDLSLEVIQPLLDKITLGYWAANTKENAREAAIWIEMNNFKTIRLVTSNYHMPRSLLEFRLIMPNIKIIPHPVSNNNIMLKNCWKFPSSISVLFTEYNKYLAVILINRRL